MLTSELEYELPPELIATQPAEPRDAARLMVVRRAEARIEHRTVRDLADEKTNLLREGDLLVFNQSRVLPAHFEATRAATGGRVSGLYVRSEPGDERAWEVMLESGGKLREGERIAFDDATGTTLELIAKLDGGLWRARLHGDESTLALLQRVGTVPLPPYIVAQRRKQEQPGVNANDLARYNTVYAKEPGSVAAPTAGLHFTDELLATLRSRDIATAFVTLHVGLGTFASIRTQRVEDHAMHGEWIGVPGDTVRTMEATRSRGGRIIPVGTTSVRAIESLPPIDENIRRGGFSGETRLLITPGDFRFRFTDALMTNFHLPHSTLLALVAALPDVGITRLKKWYGEAMSRRYRFYSYGDAMLLV